MKKIFIIALTLLSLVCHAQTYVNTKQLRFFAITTASDTAQTVGNSGRMWYDGATHHFRVNINGANQDLGTGAGGGGGGPLTINSQSGTNYNLALVDAENTLVRISNAAPNTITVPENTSVAFPIGTIITLEQTGSGLTAVTPAGSVIINGSAGNLFSPGQDTPMVIVKIATDEWDLWNGSPGLTAGNGMTITGSAIELGGTLDQSTVIDGAFDVRFATNSLSAEDLRGGTATEYVSIDGTVAEQITLNSASADVALNIVSKGEGAVRFYGSSQLAGLEITETAGELFLNQIGLSNPSGLTGMTVKSVNGNSTTNTGANASLVAGNGYTVAGNGPGGNVLLTVGQRRTAGSGADGSVVIETRDATGTLKINGGANEQCGTAVLSGGTLVVNNTKVTANSIILLTSQANGGTPGFLRISARTAGTSFTILSSSGTDTSTVGWLIIEPN